MVQFNTENVEGIEVANVFLNVGDVLCRWWDSEGTDLPGNDDAVISLSVDEYPDLAKHLKLPVSFETLITALSEIYWNDAYEKKEYSVASDIQWDMDDDDYAVLPTSIPIPEGMEDEDEISDFISDVTGYCLEPLTTEVARFLLR